MGIPLQVAEPTGRYRRALRRYSLGHHDECTAGGYHNTSNDTGEIPADLAEEAAGDNWPHDDPSWPATCACGYQFTEDDHWQRADREVYRLPDGREFVLSAMFGDEVPPGTMVRADWYDDHNDGRGETWLVILPDGGSWLTTQPAKGGGYWTVTGTPPGITVTPSIWHNAPTGWHGWIRSGFLEDA